MDKDIVDAPNVVLTLFALQEANLCNNSRALSSEQRLSNPLKNKVAFPKTMGADGHEAAFWCWHGFSVL